MLHFIYLSILKHSQLLCAAYTTVSNPRSTGHYIGQKKVVQRLAKVKIKIQIKCHVHELQKEQNSVFVPFTHIFYKIMITKTHSLYSTSIVICAILHGVPDDKCLTDLWP